jgi:hypothetical protein
MKAVCGVSAVNGRNAAVPEGNEAGSRGVARSDTPGHGPKKGPHPEGVTEAWKCGKANGFSNPLSSQEWRAGICAFLSESFRWWGSFF